mmetsp:Transcript_16415/g.41862  ORF Transcript_16415/g.41862 Transcript_16415/m.41862 type:complete len:143 (-) Transcript_16415:133-561(-)
MMVTSTTRGLSLLVIGLLAATADAFVPASSRLASSLVSSSHVSSSLHTFAVTSSRRRVSAIMADPGDSEDDWGEQLKRKGQQLVRDWADAAERLGEAIDEGLDAVLGPAGGDLIPVPIPIPVERDYPRSYDGSYDGGSYGRY